MMMAPYYDYLCESCENSFEAFHSFKERPVLPCPKCGSKKTHKTPSLCGIVMGHSKRKAAMVDTLMKESDMREELAKTYGVEKVAPLKGQTFADVYRDVKSRGEFVREEMSKTMEENAKKQKKKQKEWNKAAGKRQNRMRLEMQKQRAKEAFKKRAIRF